MRLRLRIERNALPAVQTLWPVADTSCTVAQLLQQINAIFPLEADSWGYEDYALTLAGYELLHYHIVKDVLQNEDELVIRPLGWLDLRTRTMTGRNQISVDGRHLLDGVPFGRPALRAPTRPEVRIPPRKKRRLSQGEETLNGSGGAAGYGGMITSNGDDEQDGALLLKDAAEQMDKDDDEDEEDTPYDPDAAESSEDESDDDSSESDPDTEAVDASAQARRGCEERRHSMASTTDSSSASSSADSSGQDSRDSSSDASSSDSSSESDEESWSGISKSEPPSLGSKTKKVLPNGHPPAAAAHSAQQPPKKTSISASASIPGEGSSATQHRNARRRDAKRLKYAKEAGTVRQDTTLAQYRELLHKEPRPDAGEDESERLEVDGGAEVIAASETSGPVVSAGADRSMNPKARPQLGDSAAAPVDASASRPCRKSKNANVRTEKPADLEERRQRLVQAIHSGGIDLDGNPINADEDEAEAPEEVSSKDQTAALSNSSTAPDMSPPSSSTRRARLDLAGSQRLLFGSLGIRVPKTQAEKDATQNKLFEKAKRKAVLRPEAANGESETTVPSTAQPADLSDSWRDKINLSAVECVDENVTLSEPPFPFHQRWDPQYNRKGKKRASSTYMDGGGTKKRKRANDQPLQEQYDKYNADGYGDALNYDEEEEDDYWEEGALLNGDGGDGEDVAIDDGFPELPADITSLPLLALASEARIGDFITFTKLAVDASTGWQPQMAVRTAKVLDPASGNEAAVRVQLSNRDVKPPQYDDEGNRVYDKFEMPQEDDGSEEQDARVRKVSWAELGEVRIVRKAE